MRKNGRDDAPTDGGQDLPERGKASIPDQGHEETGAGEHQRERSQTREATAILHARSRAQRADPSPYSASS